MVKRVTGPSGDGYDKELYLKAQQLLKNAGASAPTSADIKAAMDSLAKLNNSQASDKISGFHLKSGNETFVNFDDGAVSVNKNQNSKKSSGKLTTMAVGEEGGDNSTTKAAGEEGGGKLTTMAVGEEGGDNSTTKAAGEEGGGNATTMAVGEEGGGKWTTMAVGEEGGDNSTTKAVGEEGGGKLTTMAVGEEGGK